MINWLKGEDLKVFYISKKITMAEMQLTTQLRQIVAAMLVVSIAITLNIIS